MTEPRDPHREDAAAPGEPGAGAASLESHTEPRDEEAPAQLAPQGEPVSANAARAADPASEQTTPLWLDRGDQAGAPAIDPWTSGPAERGEVSQQRAPESEPARAGGVSKGVVAAVLVAGLLGGGVGAGAVIALDDDEPSSALTAPLSGEPASRADAGTVAQVAAAVLPSVVSIQLATGEGGSGVIISSDGQILTNNHVVESAAAGGAIQVAFSAGDTADARIVGRDPASDLAVIQAEDVSGLQPASLGGSDDLVVGQPVVAIGSPLGLQGTVTSGIISALDRQVVIGNDQAPRGGQDVSTFINAIQTDAAINPGNSGGPLVNTQGEVIGINTAIASLPTPVGGQSGSIGLGFAIPMDQARRVAGQLAEGKAVERAFLGVSISEAAASDANTSGALVREVQEDSPAAEAGLETGDIVTMFDDRRIDGPDALVAAVRGEAPGAEVSITYVRDGETNTTSATLGTLEAETS